MSKRISVEAKVLKTMPPTVLFLKGHVPGKKNLLRRGRGHHLYRDQGVTAEIDGLILQAREQWGAYPPIRHPMMAITFHVRSRGGDRDNKLTTILDVLQQAGVLRNDNIAHCNGSIMLLPAIVVKKGENEATVIELRTEVAFERA